MRVEIVKYNPEWATIFNCLHCELNALLMDYHPEIEHIGSTSVPGLASKPVIDLMIGVDSSVNLDEVANFLNKHDYIYYKKLNSAMPYRRFLMKLINAPEKLMQKKIYGPGEKIPRELKSYKLANIYVMEKDSDHWIRHIAFREYLKNNPSVREEYEEVKIKLNSLDFWLNSNEYHKAKNAYIRQVEEEALHWYGHLV